MDRVKLTSFTPKINTGTSHHRMGRALLLLVMLLSAALLPFAPAVQAQSDAVSLITLDGKKIKSQLTSIQGKTVNLAQGQPQDLMSLREIRFTKSDKVDYKSTPARVYMLNGSIIQGEDLEMKNRQVHLKLAGKNLQLPVEEVLGFLLMKLKDPRDLRGLTAADDSFMSMIALEQLDQDRLYIFNKGRLASLGGAVAAVGDERLSFVFNDEQKEVKREKVYGVVFAHLISGPPERLGRINVMLINGSSLWLDELALNKDTLVGKISGAELSIPREMVSKMRIISDRVIFLSDMDPIRVSSKALFTRENGAASWFRDRAADVNGEPNPIRLGGKVYDKGLCILSETTLRYRINGAYGELVASAGIDDETRGQGDCVVTVKVDGEVKFSKRYTGADEIKADPWKIDVAGGDVVEITVAFGEDGEFGDHFSLGDARFLKKKD